MSLLETLPAENMTESGYSSLQLKEMILRIISKESCKKALLFRPRSTDVIVVVPAKCGTTWMQQITHQLRTGGDMDFDEIHDLVPWIEIAHDMKYDLEAEQRATPRLFKSHLPYDTCPKGCRYIVVYRNPCSAAYSYHKFMARRLPVTVSADEFITKVWLAFGEPVSSTNLLDISYFKHLLSWNEHRNDPNVLVLFFEEMKEDLEAVVRVVASFLGIHDEEKIRVAVEMSSFEFMKANDHKFNLKRHLKRGKEPLQQIRTGSADEATKILSDDVKSRIHERWEKEITKVTGYKTYEELRRGFRKERPLAQYLNNAKL